MNIQSSQLLIEEYLSNLEEPIPTSCNPEQLYLTILNLLKEKDRTIAILSEQITKYKCDNINQTKTITSLQQKLNKLQPNANNTASNFMMASEFKDSFQNFMKSELTMAFSPLLDFPKLYAQKVHELLTVHYDYVGKQITNKLSQIIKILDMQQGTQQLVFNCLLRVFQDQWQSLLPHKKLELTQKVQKKHKEELKQMIQSDQFTQMSKQLHKLCVYMHLQQKKWEFGFRTDRFVHYNKKDHHCIDGFLKQGEPAICVLDGLVRQGHKHAALQNYVLPCPQIQQNDDSQHDTSKQGQNVTKEEQTSLLKENSIKIERNLQQNSEPLESFEVTSPVKQSLVNHNVPDKYEGKIVRVHSGKQQFQKENKPNLTLHQLLMDRNKHEKFGQIKEDIKVNNWITQKRFQLNKESGYHDKISQDVDPIMKKVKNGDFVKFIGCRKKGFSEISLKHPSSKILPYKEEPLINKENNKNFENLQYKRKQFGEKKSLQRVNSSPRIGRIDSDSSFFEAKQKQNNPKRSSKSKEKSKKEKPQLHQRSTNYQEETAYLKSIRNRIQKGTSSAVESTFDQPMIFCKKNRNEEESRIRRPKKNSVGKIISQIPAKENNGSVNSRVKLYKDIIKDKIIDNPLGKPTTDRQFKKEENRPLKIKRLRDKFVG